MDQLTKEFFSEPFPGFASAFTVEKNPLQTNIPLVELDYNIDYHNLYNIAQQIPCSKSIRTQYPYEENQPRHTHWDITVLWNDGTVEPYIDDLYYRKQGQVYPATEINPGTFGLEIKNIVEGSTGLKIRGALMSIFRAQGYFRPHRDIKLINDPLSYFWIPLNNPVGNKAKLYPYGDIDIKLGAVYLFNQENYIHAVANTSYEDRYVLVGYLDHIQTPTVNDKIINAILDQYPQASL